MFSNRIFFDETGRQKIIKRMEDLDPKRKASNLKRTKKKRKKQRKKRQTKINLGQVSRLLGKDIYLKLILELLGKTMGSKGTIKESKKPPRGMKLAKIRGGKGSRGGGGYGLPAGRGDSGKPKFQPKAKTESEDEFRERLKAELIAESPQMGMFYTMFQDKQLDSRVDQLKEPSIKKSLGELLRLQKELREGSKLSASQRKRLEKSFDIAVDSINPDVAEKVIRMRQKNIKEGVTKAEETIFGIRGGPLDDLFRVSEPEPTEAEGVSQEVFGKEPEDLTYIEKRELKAEVKRRQPKKETYEEKRLRERAERETEQEAASRMFTGLKVSKLGVEGEEGEEGEVGEEGEDYEDPFLIFSPTGPVRALRNMGLPGLDLLGDSSAAFKEGSVEEARQKGIDRGIEIKKSKRESRKPQLSLIKEGPKAIDEATSQMFLEQERLEGTGIRAAPGVRPVQDDPTDVPLPTEEQLAEAQKRFDLLMPSPFTPAPAPRPATAPATAPETISEADMSLLTTGREGEISEERLAELEAIEKEEREKKKIERLKKLDAKLKGDEEAEDKAIAFLDTDSTNVFKGSQDSARTLAIKQVVKKKEERAKEQAQIEKIEGGFSSLAELEASVGGGFIYPKPAAQGTGIGFGKGGGQPLPGFEPEPAAQGTGIGFGKGGGQPLPGFEPEPEPEKGLKPIATKVYVRPEQVDDPVENALNELEARFTKEELELHYAMTDSERTGKDPSELLEESKEKSIRDMAILVLKVDKGFRKNMGLKLQKQQLAEASRPGIFTGKGLDIPLDIKEFGKLSKAQEKVVKERKPVYGFGVAPVTPKSKDKPTPPEDKPEITRPPTRPPIPTSPKPPPASRMGRSKPSKPNPYTAERVTNDSVAKDNQKKGRNPRNQPHFNTLIEPGSATSKKIDAYVDAYADHIPELYKEDIKKYIYTRSLQDKGLHSNPGFKKFNLYFNDLIKYYQQNKSMPPTSLPTAGDKVSPRYKDKTPDVAQLQIFANELGIQRGVIEDIYGRTYREEQELKGQERAEAKAKQSEELKKEKAIRRNKTRRDKTATDRLKGETSQRYLAQEQIQRAKPIDEQAKDKFGISDSDSRTAALKKILGSKKLDTDVDFMYFQPYFETLTGLKLNNNLLQNLYTAATFSEQIPVSGFLSDQRIITPQEARGGKKAAAPTTTATATAPTTATATAPPEPTKQTGELQGLSYKDARARILEINKTDPVRGKELAKKLRDQVKSKKAEAKRLKEEREKSQKTELTLPGEVTAQEDIVVPPEVKERLDKVSRPLTATAPPESERKKSPLEKLKKTAQGILDKHKSSTSEVQDIDTGVGVGEAQSEEESEESEAQRLMDEEQENP